MQLTPNRGYVALPLFLTLIVVAMFAFPRQSHAASYNLVVDDSFQRANTSPGTTSNSTTGIGNGWIDFIGNVYDISGNKVTSTINETIPSLDGFYHDASTSDSFGNGMVRVYTSTGSASAIGRFNPSNGGSGYAAMWYPSQQYLFLYKAINGTAQFIVYQHPIAGVPSNYIEEFVIQDLDASDTVLTVNFYDEANPTTLVATYSYTDSASPLQSPGYWGAGQYNGMSVSRMQTYAYVPGGPITPGAISLTPASVFRTALTVTSATPIGGNGPYTYQWQRSTSSTTGFINIANATTTSLTDTGLAPGTTYYYRMKITDSTTPTPQVATSTPLAVTTVSSTGHIIGFIGDSITQGVGSNGGVTLTDGPGALIEFLMLQNDGYSVGYNNQGSPGSQASDWHPGGTLLTNALASFQSTGVDTVSIMLGTNDSSYSFTASSTYQTNMQNLVNALLAPATGITRVILNYPPFLNSPGNGSANSAPTLAQANSLLVQYQSSINAIASSTTGVYLGDTTLYAMSQTYASGWGFGPHPNEAGHQYMGAAWEAAYVAAFSKPSSIVAVPSSTGATITWTTDVPASTLITYGTSSSYTASTTESDISPRVTSHTATLSGLSPLTTYHFEAISRNASLAQQTANDATFITAALPDTIPPIVALTAPASGATIAGSSVTLTAISSDNVGVAGVQFQIDGSNIGSSGTTSPYSISWNSTGVTNGSHTISAVASDFAGNTATSSVSVTVSNVNISSGGGAVTSSTGGGFTVPSPTPLTVPSIPPTPCLPPARFNNTTGALCPQTAVTATPSSAGITLSVNLTFGMSNLGVRALQQFLNATGFPVASSGAGSLGHETTYFGSATRAALIRFQRAKGITPPSGYFGPITRAYIAAHYP